MEATLNKITKEMSIRGFGHNIWGCHSRGVSSEDFWVKPKLCGQQECCDVHLWRWSGEVSTCALGLKATSHLALLLQVSQ